MSAMLKEHPDFTAMKDRWQMCEDAAEGEHAVHKAGAKYLPRLTGEEDDAYTLRLRMTPFFNATWRTVTGMRGMLFRKPAVVEAGPAVLEALGNVDLAGTTFTGLAQEVVEEALVLGRVGLLVDHPALAPNATLADARSQNLRPMMSIYEADSIYNWREVQVNGVTIVTQIRLMEEACLDDANDEFAVTEQKRYRILDLKDGKYRQRLYRLNEKNEEIQIGADLYPLMNNKPMDFIPFVVIGVDCVGFDVDAPPLIDLVTTNFHHYLQATSYERGCFFSGLPTMFVSGMEASDGEIAIGGTTANALGSPNAKAYYVEVASKFEALRTNLEDKKKEMAVLGARMLEGGKNAGGVEASETVARRQSGEESVLSSMAQTVSQGLTRALGWYSRWMGSDAPVKVELNRDFLPMTMTPAEITALVSAWQNGALSGQALFANLKQGEVYSPEDTYELEQERITQAVMKYMVTQTPPGAPV